MGSVAPDPEEEHVLTTIERKWQERWRAQGGPPGRAVWGRPAPAAISAAPAPPAPTPEPSAPPSAASSDAAETPAAPAKPAHHYYLLDIFPYPTLRGFSVNQLRGMAISDVIARHQEALGNRVLRPIGWDSFGLSIENEASALGVLPEEVVERGIERMRAQITAFGARVDWEREIRTSSPEFYRWTQWIFLRMFERGLAIRQEVPIKWCAHCRMNLANEEALEGKCIHCGRGTEERRIRQWTLRITEFAGRLHRGLATLEWPLEVRRMQRNWIGRRAGYRLVLKATREFLDSYTEFDVFVRHLERVAAATFVVLAPEHPLVDSITDELYRDEVVAYRDAVHRLTERERVALQGVPDGRPTGAVALNPMTLRPMPIWISSFVLPGFGFGALLGFPAHNERHRAFAERHRLPHKPPSAKRAEGGRRFGGHGREGGRSGGQGNAAIAATLPPAEARRRVQEVLDARGALDPHVRYNLRDWIFARQRYWGEPIPVVYCDACGTVPVPDTELPVMLPPPAQPAHPSNGSSPLAQYAEFVATTCPACGNPARRETDTMPQWAASCWYYLRYLSPTATAEPFEAATAGDWLPVDLCVGGVEHAILHLLYVRFFSYFLHDLGLTRQEEPFRRLVNQGRLYRRTPTDDVKRLATHRGDPVEAGPYLERHGADALRLHLLYLGPPAADVVWSDRGLDGCRRFLARTHRTVLERLEKGKFVSRRVLVEKHRLIRRVTRAIDGLRLNNAVSAFMEFIKVLRSPEVTPEEVDRSTLRVFAILLAPFCPHLASELWERLDGSGTVFDQQWPEFSQELLRPHMVEIAVFINERVRDRLTVESGLSKMQLLEQVLVREAVKKAIGERKPQHVYHVPDRLLKLVFPPEASPAEPPGAASA